MAEKSIDVATISQPPSYTFGEAKAKPSGNVKSKKYAIIAGAILVAFALSITGTLLVLHMQGKLFKDIVEEYSITVKDKSGSSNNESVKVDVKNNIEEIDQKEQNFHIVHDFNKRLTVYRMKLNDKFACYLKPLDTINGTDMADSDALSSYFRNGGKRVLSADQVTSDENDTSTLYSPVETTVKDSSFLSDAAQLVCKDLDVHWLTVHGQDGATSTTAATPSGRNKRMIPRIDHRLPRRCCYYRIRCYSYCVLHCPPCSPCHYHTVRRCIYYRYCHYSPWGGYGCRYRSLQI